MNHLYKIYLFVLLLVLTSCSKKKEPENYSLAGMPIEKIKELTIGHFKVVSAVGGITGYPTYPDSLYVRITADSIIWHTTNSPQYGLPYIWGKISLYDKEYYGLTPYYVPERIQNGNLILVQPDAEVIGYELKRI